MSIEDMFFLVVVAIGILYNVLVMCFAVREREDNLSIMFGINCLLFVLVFGHLT